MNTSKYLKANLFCVQPPFSLVMNASNVIDTLNCSLEKHSLTTCWLEHSATAILMKEPAVIWVPIVNATLFHTIATMVQVYIAIINRIKLDFGITATSIASIVLAIGGMVAGMVSLMQATTMADTLNQIVTQSAEVLHAQEVINQHI